MWINFLLLLYIPFASELERKDSLPPTNATIVTYVTSVIGKKVDRGECWDLANEALLKAGARWDHKYNFGKPIPSENPILPGDIIQFNGVKLKHLEKDQYVTETMMQHTAIVYKVIAPGIYEIAQQNTGGRSGKKVSLYRLTLAYKIKGKIVFFRPQS